MTLPLMPMNEEQRLSALERNHMLDASSQRDVDNIARLVKAICEVPLATVSFFDAGRQWLQSAMPEPSLCATPAGSAFIALTTDNPNELFVVEDALADRRFKDEPLFCGEPHARFYACAPLTTSAGLALGSLCIIDHVPRSLSKEQTSALQTAARSVVALLEHRRTYGELRETYAAESGTALEQAFPIPRGGNDTADSRSADLPAEVIDAVPGVFYVFGANGRLLLWNKRLEEISGYSKDEIAEISLLKMIGVTDRAEIEDRIKDAFLHGTAVADASIVTKDGRSVPYYFTARIIQYRGETCAAGMGIDISERKQAEKLLEYAAHHDPLTGLGNRTVLSDRLLQSGRVALRKNEMVAVLFLDLDRFKLLNDTLGHTAGDDLLKAVAQRIRSSVRPEDTIARLGGDEFVIVADVSRSADVVALVGSVMESFRAPFCINGRSLHVTTSMGISVYPSDGAEPDQLLSNADEAMYRAKDLGRNNFQFFTHDMHAAAINRLTTEMDLRHGLDNGEFELYYQPVVDALSGAAVSAEALIRWHHPTRGLVMPSEFIAIAEDSGLIVPIGAWVLLEGARQVTRLAELGFDKCFISVNVSGRQLRDPAFLEHVRTALREFPIVPESLGIEITESAALGDPDRALAVLDQCKRAGLLVLLDDFGTYYSSLTYLKKFPIDVIKIDKSFVDGLPGDPDDCGIVKAIVALGRGLHCEVLAEGVESAVQATWLSDNECRYATGYFYARPMPVLEFEAWLRRSRDTACAGRADSR